MPRWRRAAAFLLPSVVAAFAGTLVAGLAEGLTHLGSVSEAFAASGFLGVYAIPIGLAGALVARGLWRSWQFDRLIERARAETGGVPALAAWLVYAIAAGWVLAAACFNTVFVLSHKTSSRPVVALASTIIVVGFAAVLVTCSRPTARALTWAFGRLERFTNRRVGRSLLTPRIIAVAAAVVVVGLVYAAWLVSIQPRIGHLDMSFALYLLLFVAGIAGVHLLAPVVSRNRLLAGACAALVCGAGIASMAAAINVRYSRPYAMLEIWGDTHLAGAAIDMLYDIQLLRGEFDLEEFAPKERPGAVHRDVILVTIDTVRADYTPPYGGRASMPTLQRLANEGALFEWAFSPGNVTRRSLPTIAMGVSPHRVHGRVAGWALRLDPRHVLLAERFREAGYETAGFLCCESQFAPRHRLGLIRGIDHLVLIKDGNKLSEAAHAWLAERAAKKPKKPLFMWMHLIEPHLWEELYSVQEYGSDNRRRYKASLADADRFLGRTIEGLGPDALKTSAFLVVTADHGEGLGDHGSEHHSTNLYNSQIHVPLVIVGPGIAPQRVQQVVGLVDLAPTMLDLAGFIPPGMPQMDGKSLAPLLRGEVEPDNDGGEAYSVMVADRSVKHGMSAIVEGSYKLIQSDGNKNVELYNLRRDKQERRNLAKRKPELVKKLLERLAARRAVDAVPPF